MATSGEVCMQNKEVLKYFIILQTKYVWHALLKQIVVFWRLIYLFIFWLNTGRRWIKQMFIGAFMIPAMVCGTAFFINFIAIYYHASRAIPFGTMVGFHTAAPP